MPIFVIYHMVGIKVGCTKDLDKRSLKNRMRYGMDAEIVVLEELTDAKRAGDRERHWSDHFGYRRQGPHYTQSLAALSAMGKSGARSPYHASQRPEVTKRWQAAGAAAAYIRVACPHCGKEGAARPMLRWHFDRCKQRAAA